MRNTWQPNGTRYDIPPYLGYFAPAARGSIVNVVSDRVRRPLCRVLRSFKYVKQDGADIWQWNYPALDDKHATLTINPGIDGRAFRVAKSIKRMHNMTWPLLEKRAFPRRKRDPGSYIGPRAGCEIEQKTS